jgi:hypothetical protein
MASSEFPGGTIVKILGFALMISGAILTWRDNTAGALANFGAGLLVLLFGYPHVFKSLSAFGVQAELRETITQAKDAIAELRNFAAPTAAISFYTSAWGNRMASEKTMQDGKRLHRKQQDAIIASLRSMGVSASEIEEMLRPWHEVNLFDLAHPIADEMRDVLNEADRKAQQEVAGSSRDPQHPERKEIQERIGKISRLREETRDSLYRPFKENSSAMFIPLVDSYFFLTEAEKDTLKAKIRPLIDDMDFYIQHRRHKPTDS